MGLKLISVFVDSLKVHITLKFVMDGVFERVSLSECKDPTRA